MATGRSRPGTRGEPRLGSRRPGLKPRGRLTDAGRHQIPTAIRRRSDVKIPLVGGKIEMMIGASLANSITMTLYCTTILVAEHALSASD